MNNDKLFRLIDELCGDSDDVNGGDRGSAKPPASGNVDSQTQFSERVEYDDVDFYSESSGSSADNFWDEPEDTGNIFDPNLPINKSKIRVLDAIHNFENVYTVLLLLAKLAAEATEDNYFYMEVFNAVERIYGKIMEFRNVPEVKLAEKEEILREYDRRLNSDIKPNEMILKMDKARLEKQINAMGRVRSGCDITF